MLRKENMNGTVMAAELGGGCSGFFVEVRLGAAACRAAELEPRTGLCWGSEQVTAGSEEQDDSRDLLLSEKQRLSSGRVPGLCDGVKIILVQRFFKAPGLF